LHIHIDLLETAHALPHRVGQTSGNGRTALTAATRLALNGLALSVLSPRAVLRDGWSATYGRFFVFWLGRTRGHTRIVGRHFRKRENMKNEDNRRRGRRHGLERAVDRRCSETQCIRGYLIRPGRKARKAELAVLIGPGNPSLVGGRIFHANSGARNRDAAIRLNNTSH